MKKKKGNTKIAIAIKFFAIFMIIIVFVFPFCVSRLNYNHNVIVAETFFGYSSEGYIEDQDLTEELSYGLRSSDKAGCGWISAYNTLTYLKNKGLYNKEIDLATTIREIDSFGTLLFGYLGTNPLVLSLYIESKGFNVKTTFKESDFETVAKSSDVNIILYIDKKLSYAHYQMVNYVVDTNDFNFHCSNRIMSMDNYLDSRGDDYKILFSIYA